MPPRLLSLIAVYDMRARHRAEDACSRLWDLPAKRTPRSLARPRAQYSRGRARRRRGLARVGPSRERCGMV